MSEKSPDLDRQDFFEAEMFGENFRPERIKDTTTGTRFVTLDPNDGRFDDIDDEDPMEGVAPYVKDDKQSFTVTLETSSAWGGASFIQRIRAEGEAERGGANFAQRMEGQSGVGVSRDTFFLPSGNRREVQSDSFDDISSQFGFLRMPTNRRDSEHEKTAQRQEKKQEKPEVFAYEKIPGTFRDPPTEKFKQPAKENTITTSRGSYNPDGFLSSLKYGRDGLGMYRRGYFKNITPMPHDTPKPSNHTRFVCISDTHSEHTDMKVPDGDVLLHCGDFTESGKLNEIDDFNVWLGELPHKHKIVIAGNHELSFDMRKMEKVKRSIKTGSYVRFGTFLKKIPEETWRNWRARLSNCTFLEDQEVKINGIRIYGSPWQPEFGDLAFNLPRGAEILEKWNKIPGDGIDILMTHGPPVGHGDRIVGGDHVGCVDLLNTVQLRVQPKYHLFGHIHEDYGFSTDQFTIYANCSSVNYHYETGHPAFVFDLPNKSGEEDTFVGPISY